jgi:hypothetical protein
MHRIIGDVKGVHEKGFNNPELCGKTDGVGGY